MLEKLRLYAMLPIIQGGTNFFLCGCDNSVSNPSNSGVEATAGCSLPYLKTQVFTSGVAGRTVWKGLNARMWVCPEISQMRKLPGHEKV